MQDTPIRYRALRNDATIDAAIRWIERRLKVWGVQFVDPSGKVIGRRRTIRDVRHRWRKHRG